MSTRRPPSNHEPDDLDAPVPEPGDEPTAAERSSARAFGDLIDKALAGRTPPAMPAGDRELLEVATIIRSVAHPAELPAQRAASLVDGALRQAVGDRPASFTNPDGVIPLAARRRDNRLPWAMTAVSTVIAAAAVTMLLIRRPVATAPAPSAPPAAAATTADVPDHWRSRPTDELIGQITPERSAEAGARVDAIFADRMSGFRERTLAGRRRTRGGAP
jgi:hypothetical protein